MTDLVVNQYEMVICIDRDADKVAEISFYKITEKKNKGNGAQLVHIFDCDILNKELKSVLPEGWKWSEDGYGNYYCRRNPSDTDFFEHLFCMSRDEGHGFFSIEQFKETLFYVEKSEARRIANRVSEALHRYMNSE